MIPPVAVIADAHVHFPEGDYGGAGLVWQGRRRVWRSLADTAGGGRVVNESLAAFRAALDAIAARGVRHVVLLGDYTDDGQAETTARLAVLLRARADLAFYALPGNHDVFASHGKHIATRFATSPHTTELVTSDPRLAATEAGAILTPAMRMAGQPEALLPMAAFGYVRQPGYLHWETPFGASDRAEDRIYLARSADGSAAHSLMDASYLVEPSPGLWLLMLDANVFVPNPGPWRAAQKRAFADPSDAGWNALPQGKPHLLPWITDVAARARAGGKMLLAFSHYPAVGPFHARAGHDAALFGDAGQVRRMPGQDIAVALARAGIRLHLSGHIHTASISRAAGLVDVAVPSTTAFPGGYAILTPGQGEVTAELVPLTSVPEDSHLAAFYRASGAEEVPDYRALLSMQVRNRMAQSLTRDWPPEAAAGVRDARVGDVAGSLGLPAGPCPDLAFAALLADAALLRSGGPLAGPALDADRLAALRHLARGAATTGGDAPLRRYLDMVAAALTRLDAGASVTVALD